MKRLVVIALLSVLLTSCAEQTNRGQYEPQEEVSDEQENDNAIFSQIYSDEETQEMIGASVLLDNNKKLLNLSYFPSNNDEPDEYETKCYAFIGFADSMLKEDFTLIIAPTDEKYSYCKILIERKGDNYKTAFKNRNGTQNADIGDWLEELYNSSNSIPKTSSTVWIAETMGQIQKDIEGIYP